MSDLAALRDRCATAAATLEILAADNTNIHQSARLYSKAEGVRLALSYIEEAERATT